MAIGVRITSNNLSGKTADVTFTSITGTPLNIGAKTVPFNYYESYPYGTYDLYFSEYDYTYTIFVPDPTPLVINLRIASKYLFRKSNCASAHNPTPSFVTVAVPMRLRFISASSP